MRSLSAVAALALPVRHRGIQLARPVDLLLETGAWRAVGFVALCGDDALRFLPYAASQPGDEEISVRSALMLLDDVDFYRARSDSLRALLGGTVERRRREAGVLRDVLLARDGAVTALEVERGGTRLRLPPDGATVSSSRASAA